MLELLSDVSMEGAAGGFVAFIFGALKVVTLIIEHRNKKRLQHIEKYTPPSDPAPPGQQPEELTGSQAIQREVRTAMVEWNLSECRARVKELEQQLREISSDMARTAMAVSAERIRGDRAEAKLEVLQREHEQLRHELEASEKRAAALARELAECKRQDEGRTKGAPLRPKPRAP